MDERVQVYENKMQKSLENLISELGTIRAGRANPHILDKIQVEYYGTPTPLQQVAYVTVPEPRMIQIQPWEGSLVKAIEKAIHVSDLGINPTNDGKVLRITFPPLTEERRRDIVKQIHKLAEDTKVAIRSIRRDSMEKFKTMKKNSEITEDDLKDCEKEVQNLTDKFCLEVEKIAKDKEKEIMSV